MSRQPTRRRLDVEARRAAILDAAAAHYATAGYSTIAVTDVAAAAGVSQALVFHYFGSKADLYAAVVDARLRALATAQAEAAQQAPAGTPVRDRVRAVVETVLDDVAAHRAGAGPLPRGDEPEQARLVRAAARAADVERLAGLLGTGDWRRHAYAVRGALGFLDEACRMWVEHGCPDADRGPLVEAALGALEGALGDWAV